MFTKKLSSSWGTSDFVLHYSEGTPHMRMANMWTEKHEFTGREWNRPLNWPFFLKLWPWPLEEKRQNFFSPKLSDFIQQAALWLWPRAFRPVSYILKMFLTVGKIKACLRTLDASPHTSRCVDKVLPYCSWCSDSFQGSWQRLGNRTVVPGRDQAILQVTHCHPGICYSEDTVMIKWRSEVKVTQSCPTLCNYMDYRIHEILQARILECIAGPFSRGSYQPRGQTQVSHAAGRFFTSWATRLVLLFCIYMILLFLFLFSRPVLFGCFVTPWIGIFQARILECVSIFFPQSIFPTQESNPCLLPESPALQADSLPLNHLWLPRCH